MPQEVSKTKIYLFAVAFKEKRTGRLYTKEEIKELFQNIKDLPYKRHPKEQEDLNSKYQWLGDVAYSMFVDRVGTNDIDFFIGRERAGDFPPTIEQTENNQAEFGEINVPETKHLIERAHGRVFFDTEFPNHAIILFQHNHHSCYFSRVCDYIKKKTDCLLKPTILLKAESIAVLISRLRKIRFIQIRNQEIMPAINFGTERVRRRNGQVYKSNVMQLSCANLNGTPRQILQGLYSAFAPDSSWDSFETFAAESKMKLTALKISQTKYTTINLAKNLYTFDYLGTDNHNFDKQEFYRKCQTEYSDNLTEIKDLVRAISDFDNSD